jgi:hypothetical protein
MAKGGGQTSSKDINKLSLDENEEGKGINYAEGILEVEE